MPAQNKKKRRIRIVPIRTSEVLDVKMAAELLTVSPDTVYGKHFPCQGYGDRHAITTALKSGKAQLKKR
jgi:hypothetical protein